MPGIVGRNVLYKVMSINIIGEKFFEVDTKSGRDTSFLDFQILIPKIEYPLLDNWKRTQLNSRH